MEAVLTFLGEYSWGILPAGAHSFVFWTLTILGLLLFFWTIKNLPKAVPEGIRGYDSFNPGRSIGLAVNTENGNLRPITAHNQAEENARAIFTVQILAIFLLMLPALRMAGSFAFSKEPALSENVAMHTLSNGQMVDTGGRVYTCARTINGPVFTYSFRGSLLTADQSVDEVVSRSKRKDLTWWGSFENIHLEKKKYVCQT